MSLIIGSHVSFLKEKQLLGSVLEALSYGANTFMFYTGAPQNTNRMPIDNELTKLAHELMKKEGIDHDNVIVHAPYIINMANPNNFDFNADFLKQEIERVERLGLTKLVIHPGSHVGLGREEGIKNIIKVLNKAVDEKQNVSICLEYMAGKGTEIGSNIEDLKEIIDGVSNPEKYGVCLDTCHLNDSGFDVSNFDILLDQIDKSIGLSKLCAIHINDSKNNIGDKKDRHANLGDGTIGFETLLNIVYNPRLKKVPKILETPYIEDNPPYKYEIAMLRCKKMNKSLAEDVIMHYNK